MSLTGHVVRFALPLALVALQACGGGPSAAPPAVSHKTGSARAHVTPLVMTRAALAALPRAHLKGTGLNLKLAPLRMTSSARRSPRSSVAGGGDLELAGTYIQSGGPYNAMYVEHTAYPAASFPLSYPAGASGPQLLLAPVSTAPNGDCLAAATVAYDGGSGTSTEFAVLDQCSGDATVASAPIDDDFANLYVGTNFDGLDVYSLEIGTPDVTPTSSSTWYVLIFDYLSGGWDVVAQRTGLYSTTYGFTAYYQSYQPGPCPSALPPVASDNLSLYDTASIFPTFESTAYPPAYYATSEVDPGDVGSSPNCFTDDGTGAATDTFTMIAPNAFWAVTRGS